MDAVDQQVEEKLDAADEALLNGGGDLSGGTPPPGRRPA